MAQIHISKDPSEQIANPLLTPGPKMQIPVNKCGQRFNPNNSNDCLTPLGMPVAARL